MLTKSIIFLFLNKKIMDKTIFFNSSLPRAGSTLFQNLIGQNPEFYVTPTSGLIELILKITKQIILFVYYIKNI
jgi:hypothetical protein